MLKIWKIEKEKKNTKQSRDPNISVNIKRVSFLQLYGSFSSPCSCLFLICN